MNYIYLLLFILIVSIIIISIIYYFISNNNKFSFYHKDMKFNSLFKNILKNHNINNNNNKWNIFVPKGYTYIENQLENLKLSGHHNKYYIFGIKGCDKIVSKNNIWMILVNEYGRNNSKNIMPETYIISYEHDINKFKQNYDNKNIYIMKKNIQRKQGLYLSNNYYDIIDEMKNGYKIIQKYKTDLFLINKRKINMRIYFLIINDNKTIKYYLSSLGKCIYTNKDIDNNIYDLDFEKHITSYNLDLKIYDKNPQSLKQLKSYLGSNSKILFNKINKLFLKISKAIHNHLLDEKLNKKCVYFQHFGADVVFDNNFNPYLLEFNKGPDMNPKNDLDEKMKTKIYYDILHKMNIIKNFNNNNSFYLIYEK